jgi:hypothetical protein
MITVQDLRSTGWWIILDQIVDGLREDAVSCETEGSAWTARALYDLADELETLGKDSDKEVGLCEQKDARLEAELALASQDVYDYPD